MQQHSPESHRKAGRVQSISLAVSVAAGVTAMANGSLANTGSS